MSTEQPNKGPVVLIVASFVSAALGSVHAFSVFLETLEIQFTASRSAVSLTYSLALVSLTLAVLLGPRFFERWSAATIVLFACVAAACGTLLAGVAGSLAIVWLGYSLIFGAANGLGYGYGLQIAAQVNPGREGLAMGTVTAAYAFGAIVSPALFDRMVDIGGFSSAMLALTAVLLGVGVLGALLLKSVDAKFVTETHRSATNLKPGKKLHLMWLGYFGGVLAGLMVIGHAAGIAAALRPDMAAWLAPVAIAACNLVGSLVGGRLADRVRLGLLLAILALLTFAALCGLAVFGRAGGLMIGLGIIGFAYGGTIAAYPAAIAKVFGMQDSARIYGRIFTAWGCAGLIGPWFAGFLFDWSGGYRTALMVAASVALVSAATVSLAFRQERPMVQSSD